MSVSSTRPPFLFMMLTNLQCDKFLPQSWYPPFACTRHTSHHACFTLHRQGPWNVQNFETRGTRQWKTLAAVAADALICATGGFPSEVHNVQLLPVFAQPFSTLKKMPHTQGAAQLFKEDDADNLSAFLYETACQCK